MFGYCFIPSLRWFSEEKALYSASTRLDDSFYISLSLKRLAQPKALKRSAHLALVPNMLIAASSFTDVGNSI